MSSPPELSIIVPVLNESAHLPDLFRTVTAQRGVDFELLLCDGDSADGTPQVAGKLADEATFACRLLTSDRGRAPQMNAGAAAAAGEYLLFLHADSAFADPLALRHGLDALRQRLGQRGDQRAAGRFALRFRRQSQNPSLGFFFYQCKARLDRPGCLHGDQGFLLHRHFFAEAGPFDGRLGLLEDDRFAERVRQIGEWLLLPALIETSARRFEVEGLAERQILNALLMNFAAIGWEAFFRAAPGVYREQAEAGRLRLAPFFRLVRTLLQPLPLRRRLQLWYATGTYVRANAWQLAFWVDARRAFRQGTAPSAALDAPALALWERWLDPLTDHPPGRLAAALLTWIWFHAWAVLLQWQEGAPVAHPEKGD